MAHGPFRSVESCGRTRRVEELFARPQAHKPVTNFLTGVASFLMTKDAEVPRYSASKFGAIACVPRYPKHLAKHPSGTNAKQGG